MASSACVVEAIIPSASGKPLGLAYLSLYSPAFWAICSETSLVSRYILNKRV